MDTFQLLSGWLKALVFENIQAILVTLDTFQLLSGWLRCVFKHTNHILHIHAQTALNKKRQEKICKASPSS